MTPILQNPNAILAPILQSPVLFWQLRIKPNTTLAPILESPYVILGNYIKPNNTLTPIYNSSNIILAKTITLCSKAQNYFLTKTYLHILMSLTHGKYTLLISQKIFLLQNLWELCLFFFP